MPLGARGATGLSLDWLVWATHAEAIFPLVLAMFRGAFPTALSFLFCGEGCSRGFCGRLSDASSGAGLWSDGDGIDAWFMGFVLSGVSHGETTLKPCFVVS